MKDDELARNRVAARTLLSDLQDLVVAATTDEDWARLRGIGDDPDIFVDLARLWQEDSVEKAIGAYETAVSVAAEAENASRPVDLRKIRMSSNLGALFQLQGNMDTAERVYQEALQKLASETSKEADILKTVLAYNLARAYEDDGEVVQAAQWYRDVLRQHPEHMECRSLAQLAKTHVSQQRYDWQCSRQQAGENSTRIPSSKNASKPTKPTYLFDPCTPISSSP